MTNEPYFTDAPLNWWTAALNYWPILIAAAVLVVAALAVLLVLRSRYRKKLRTGRQTVTLLIQLPKETGEEGEKTAGTEKIREDIAVTETIFATIGGMPSERGLKTWFAGPEKLFAFEIVASHGLISFYVTMPSGVADLVEQQIHAQYPDALITRSPDWNMFSPTSTIVGCSMKFKRESYFPIKTYKKLESDPLSALTHPLTKLRDKEGIAFQFIFKSARPSWRDRGIHIAKGMQQGKSLRKLQNEHTLFGILGSFFEAAQTNEKREKDRTKEREIKLSPMEEEMVKGLEEKSAKAGMDANIRIVVAAEDKERAATLLQNAVAAFGQYGIYEFGNTFYKSVPGNKKEFLLDFIYRSFSDRSRIILNTEEAVSLWHLPLPTMETPNINWLIARGAPPPSNLPTEGLLMGHVNYRGVKTEVRIKKGDRQRHMYLMGKSGSGKTEAFQNMAIQDIRNGAGVCILDPHGDMAKHLLGLIPPERVDDVIIFNPSDMDRPIGMNMLEAKTPEERDFMVQEMIAIFYKMFPPEYLGPMFEHSFRNVMLTLMADTENPGTIVDIPRMFTDNDFAKKYSDKVTDPNVRSYWENEMMRNILGQAKSAFDFREIMDKKKIMIVNLSKGTTGELNSQLLGLIIVSKLQMAALGRANIPEEQRHDFYLYIDEFQNFITDSISTILSEARKYRLCLIVAHQYLAQLETNGKTTVKDAILGNVG
ncbi:MAG: type IV secretion system DNA-binding domain-containing protein, partial [bacterium]